MTRRWSGDFSFLFSVNSVKFIVLTEFVFLASSLLNPSFLSSFRSLLLYRPISATFPLRLPSFLPFVIPSFLYFITPSFLSLLLSLSLLFPSYLPVFPCFFTVQSLLLSLYSFIPFILYSFLFFFTPSFLSLLLSLSLYSFLPSYLPLFPCFFSVHSVTFLFPSFSSCHIFSLYVGISIFSVSLFIYFFHSLPSFPHFVFFFVNILLVTLLFICLSIPFIPFSLFSLFLPSRSPAPSLILHVTLTHPHKDTAVTCTGPSCWITNPIYWPWKILTTLDAFKGRGWLEGGVISVASW